MIFDFDDILCHSPVCFSSFAQRKLEFEKQKPHEYKASELVWGMNHELRVQKQKARNVNIQNGTHLKDREG